MVKNAIVPRSANWKLLRASSGVAQAGVAILDTPLGKPTGLLCEGPPRLMAMKTVAKFMRTEWFEEDAPPIVSEVAGSVPLQMVNGIPCVRIVQDG